jgi:DNA-binding CsgD family transcriptional regulator
MHVSRALRSLEFQDILIPVGTLPGSSATDRKSDSAMVGPQIEAIVEETAMVTLTRAWLIIPGADPGARSYLLTEGRQTLGRSPTCHLHLKHPTVSSRHAEILQCGELLWVHDLGSRNGTYVDDRRVDRARLDVGHSLRLGLVTLQVVADPCCDSIVDTEELPARLPDCLHEKACELSAAQLRVLHLLIEGRSEKAIAARLFLSQNTVHSHVTAIYRQLEVHSRSEFLCRYLGQPAH